MNRFERSLLSADDARFEAMIAASKSDLTSILHDELVYTHSSGRVDRKQAYMEGITSGRVKYQKVGFPQRIAIVDGETGVLYGRVLIDVVSSGIPRTLDILFTSTWVSREGPWKMIAWASTAIPSTAQ